MPAYAGQLAPALQQWFKLGSEHILAERWTEAERVNRLFLAERPDVPEARYHLGLALKGQLKSEEAIAQFRQAIALRPDFPEPWNSLGDTLREMNRLDEALPAMEHALNLRPNFPGCLINMGILMRLMNKPAETIRAYRRALELDPNSLDAWHNLGLALRQMHRFVEAAQAHQQALKLDPNNVPIWNSIALAWKDAGQINEAVASFDRTLALQPDQIEVASSRLYTLNFHSDFDAPAIYRSARQWNDRFARPLAAEIAGHHNDPSPQRRLRIGYVSSDFRRHCAALFLTPLLSHHDHREFEVFCYSGVAMPDGVTARLRSHSDQWRDVAQMTDQALTQQIRDDQIDILVDLALHTAGARLLVFARKPAPVQVTWLGYPGTTGLDAIDYRLTDPRLDPPDSGYGGASGTASGACPHAQSAVSSSGQGVCANQDTADSLRSLAVPLDRIGIQQSYYSERSVYLPDGYWCYDPGGMDEEENIQQPVPGPLPALAAGHVTFGCLNSFYKISDRTLKLWACVLAAMPNAHMLLVAPAGPPRDRVVQMLGVARERVEFVAFQPWRQYLETYGRIDICLDTLPFNGGTSGLDALWMGTPLVTRVGNTVVGRAGWSHLHNLGLTELVARSDDQFVKLAVELAGDLDRLGHLHSTLRPRMERSPLMDARRFAGNMENAYRQMWQAWCAAKH